MRSCQKKKKKNYFHQKPVKLPPLERPKQAGLKANAEVTLFLASYVEQHWFCYFKEPRYAVAIMLSVVTGQFEVSLFVWRCWRL